MKRYNLAKREASRTLLRSSVPALIALTALMNIAADGGTRWWISARTRTYFIAADEVTWDYVPGGFDRINEKRFVDSAYFAKEPPRAVGSAYKKVLYREYTDSTFHTLATRPAKWQHLGFLGPVLRGAVGDTIRVVFRNNGHRPYSVHPHGVFYEKNSEGVPYNDSTRAGAKADDEVAPGGTYTYIWAVPARAGPGPRDGSSVMWMYHSHVEEVRDIVSGLMGPIIITARGMARADGSPNDVDREIVADFAQVHEEDNWFADDNIGTVESMKRSPPLNDRSKRQFNYPSFVKFSINGYLFGSLPLQALTIRRREHVRWYLMSSTNEYDAHMPHWDGNTVIVGGMRTDVVNLLPMNMMVADMIPDDVGTWLFECQIFFHNEAGMALRYRVVE